MLNRPTLNEIRNLDISELYSLAIDNNDNARLLKGDPGVEHYKLLAWISCQFNNVIITEIGTLGGLGTIALSFNPSNKVTSFDIRSYAWGNSTPKNAEKKIVYPRYMDEVLQSSIIFYDAAHEGKEEKEFLYDLIKNKWKGILVLDDIHLNTMMQEFWDAITLPKEDWTLLGHHSGTGIVFFE